MMAVYNDPKAQPPYMILAESTNEGGVQLRKVTYEHATEDLKYSYIDASSIYDGTVEEDCFSAANGCYIPPKKEN